MYDSRKEDTSKYWKPLRMVIEDYVNHPESKLEGTTGKLTRRHLHITKEAIRYIGKETNELEGAEVTGADPEDTLEIINLEALIPALRPDEAAKIGISPRALYYHQEIIKIGKPLNLKDGIKMKYIRYFNLTLS